jgi:Protein of unknown function (DUF3617)
MSIRSRSIRVLPLIVLSTLMIARSAHTASPAVLTPGKWQVTLHTTQPVDVPAMTSVSCLTAEDIARIGTPVGKATDDCKISNVSFTGTALSYTTTCASTGRRTTLSMSYAADSFTGTQTITETDGSAVTQTFTGTRLGACDAQ